MTSPAPPAAAGSAGRKLRSLKEILRLLHDRGLLVAKSTLWGWRRRLPPGQKPPIRSRLDGTRLVIEADRRKLVTWIERMERKGLFSRSVKVRDTRYRRRPNPPPNPNLPRN